jgi:hypothetical protein
MIQFDKEVKKSLDTPKPFKEVIKKEGKRKKSRKTKKKRKKDIDIELEDIIRENNLFLKSLNQQFKSLEAKVSNLTEKPIKIKIIK